MRPPTTDGVWRAIGAWLPAVVAVFVACWVALYVNLAVLLFGPFPRDLAEPTAAFVSTVLVVLAGALFSPRRRLAAALLLSLICLGAVALELPYAVNRSGAATGVVVAVAWVGWSSYPRRTRRARAWVAGLILSACAAFAYVVYVRYVDRYERPDPLPAELLTALGPNAARVAAFYAYDLGGFIDRERLWRIEATPEIVGAVQAALKLQRVSAVPDRFWGMPPHYWPRSSPRDAETFQSPEFSGNDRGPDGLHYFLLHDRAQGRAFVWVKDNF